MSIFEQETPIPAIVIFQQEVTSEDVSIFQQELVYMSFPIFVENVGCVVSVAYQYLAVTLAEIQAYKDANYPQSEAIYRAWDARNRSLSTAGASVQKTRFEIVEEAGVVQTVYNIPGLVDATIISVTVEGIGIDETNPAEVNISTVTGDVELPNAVATQRIHITYKK